MNTISILICTHQRAESLHRTLTAVAPQAHARGIPIVVVDNASSDHTAAVVRACPGATYVHEPRLGLCHARNRGWREATTPFVAYLDDDALPADGWVESAATVLEHDREAGCVGGPVVPAWDVPQPPWLSRQVALGLTIVDWPGPRRVLEHLDREWLVGANLACRVSALRDVGGFEPRLDRQGERLLSSGDVYLQKRLMRLGYRCVYEPAMSVTHRVEASRVTREWLRRRYFWQGVSDTVMRTLDEQPSIVRRGAWAVSGAARALLSPRALVDLRREHEDAAAFERQCWTWLALGRVAGCLGAGRA